MNTVHNPSSNTATNDMSVETCKCQSTNIVRRRVQQIEENQRQRAAEEASRIQQIQEEARRVRYDANRKFSRTPEKNKTKEKKNIPDVKQESRRKRRTRQRNTRNKKSVNSPTRKNAKSNPICVYEKNSTNINSTNHHDLESVLVKDHTKRKG